MDYQKDYYLELSDWTPFVETREFFTNHGFERFDERLRKKVKRMPDEHIKHVLTHGIEMNSLKGSFFRWVDKKRWMYPGKTLIVHQGYMYVFSKGEPALLITSYPIPATYKKELKRLERKKRRGWLN